MKNLLRIFRLGRTPQAIAFVLAGLMLVLAEPAASQTTEVPGPAAANEAYQNFSSELQARKQKAYDLLEQGHRKKALRLFKQAHAADPGDSAITLQLGHLYQDTGKLAKAREMFEAERSNQDPQVSAQATAALQEVSRRSASGSAHASVIHGLFRKLRCLFGCSSKPHSDPQDESLPEGGHSQTDEPASVPGSAWASKPHSEPQYKSLPEVGHSRQTDEPTSVPGSAWASKPHSEPQYESPPEGGHSRQPDEPTSLSGSAAANDAYQELSLKHYEAAIREFQKALSLNPSNADWRTDLAYTQLSAGSPKEAAKEFEMVYRDHPEQLKIALELGYLYLQFHNSPTAEKYFAAAQSSVDPEVSSPARQALQDLRASELQARKQKAYDLLEQGHRKEALGLFEQAHVADPSDSAITLQLGYLYQETGKLAKAREMFEAERSNQDPRVSGQATAALKEVNHQSAWWFASAYVAPFYESRFANQINPIEFKVGLRVNRYLEPYVGTRFTRDIRSTSGTLPVIYSDNSDVFSVGLQSHILGHGTNLYAEAGTAVSLMSRPVQGRAVPDYRAGITWYKPWETSLAEAAKKRSRNFSLTGNAYSDISFYSRYNDNVIGYLQIRQGINLPTAHLLPMQALAVINVVRDSNGEFYNNVVEAGPALRIAPFRRLLNLQFEVDYLRGVYTAHDPTNPYGSSYGDARVFLIWSKDF